MNIREDPQCLTLRVRLDLAYDGSAFHGWAVQPGLRTVEGALREGLATLLRREVPLIVAGRTDAGVHARGQVVHLDLSLAEYANLGRDRGITPEEALVRRLTGVLHGERGAVVVFAAAIVSQDFDARFSALSRTYRYRIADAASHRDPLRRLDTAWHRVPLNAELMRLEAASVAGLQDYGSFCRPRERSTTIRELHDFSIHRDADGVILAALTADAFCHHMVRALMGACLDVGEGRRAPGWLMSRLAEPVWDQRVRLAPPGGLVLESVQYPADEQLGRRAEQTRALRQPAEQG
ncbi:tRNA pseudouridine synthase A [Nesterenkonia sp. LB17]|uniref:tRNA pseudouridine synthase A n=1 Tax=unclassified Nesterenkonia TaxID=2629769 RepID=UPI001F4CBDE6|nr:MULTISPECIES: tRNA pseudouridine synthase A [unclassified Nesterenkonia]MCH8560508.1 tRNA pseudouridine synthase A [Nesterenkonia sp. DZ6]MCH8562775.1 tRNA pseudouridine synthase A [Nesterenkonia sp. YGD6]MCH8565824.1 tRNA pseudouridine synthase A [Nesterenkonia sp. LB17]MCH8570616.1 tRNA pseudouridine synthase A [Nesterenkonia sp. AY15]